MEYNRKHAMLARDLRAGKSDKKLLMGVRYATSTNAR